MVILKKSGGFVLRIILITHQLMIEQGKDQEVVLIVVVKWQVKTIIFCPYSQRLQMNGIPPRMGD